MQIAFDPDKNAANIAKHGMSLAETAEFDFRTAKIEADDRFDYGEDRFIALGLIGSRVHVLVFTIRGGVLRAISLRKANSREVRSYD